MKTRTCLLAILAVVVWLVSVGSPASAQKFKVAGVLPASVKDLSWNALAQEGLNRVKEKYGAETSLTEMVSDADAERVIRDYANRGYHLIICHSFNFQDACLRVAKDFPNVHFANMSGFKTAPNMIACDWLSHETGYLAGVIAGLMTKTNRIGAIGGFAVPSIVRELEGFKLGVQAVNPRAEVFTTYAGTWRDTAKGLEAALALIENKVDVLISDGNGLTVGAIKGAEQKGIKAIGAIGDLHPLAPQNVLTSIVYNIPGTIEILTERTLKGIFKEGSRFLALGLKDRGTFLAPYRGNVPDSVAKRVEEFQAKIVSGELKVPQIDKPPKK